MKHQDSVTGRNHRTAKLEFDRTGVWNNATGESLSSQMVDHDTSIWVMDHDVW